MNPSKGHYIMGDGHENDHGYKPEVILLTGGAGFVGSHVCEHFVRKYAEYKVVVLDKLDYCSNMKNLQGLRGLPNFKFVKGDLCEEQFVNYLIETEGIDTIIHFAAQTHVDNSFGNSISFTKNNVFATHVLLEAARKHIPQIRRFVHVSTDEVYGGTQSDLPEGSMVTSTLEPTNPYAATKACAEMLVKAYLQSYKLPLIVTRGNNVYGPRQFPEKLIPKFITLARQDRPLPIHGDGKQSRSFIFVTDVAQAFDIVLHQGTVGETYNIGTGEEETVDETAKMICELLGKDAGKLIEHVEDRLYQDRRYIIDDSKLRALGWKPIVSWKEGISKTADWYQDNREYWADIDHALRAHSTMPVP